MWFKPNRQFLLGAIVLALLSGLFACSQERGERADTNAKSSYTTAQNEPEQIKLEILVKDEQPTQWSPVQEKASTQTTTDATQTAPITAPMTPGNYAAGGYPGSGYAGGAAPVGADVPPPYGAGFMGPGFLPGIDGPWFGPGWPFFVSDFVAWDDEEDDGHRGRRGHHHDNDHEDDNHDDHDDGLKTTKKRGR